ncbi:MAG: flagellar export chaperone FlgN [Nitrospinae bacterium]|nr:flagellar export chaperone FlgN [Nitrospinota bacterium]
MINYLKEELNCYEAILSLTRRQRDALINGRENTIEGIIKEKDILIDKVKEIDKNINLEVRSRESGVGSQIKALTKKIESILSETVEIENECRGIIANNMTSLSNEIKVLDKGRQIARGYSEKGIYTPKFIRTKT